MGSYVASAINVLFNPIFHNMQKNNKPLKSEATRTKKNLFAIDPKLKAQLDQAVYCYVKDRYQEAVSILKKILKVAPNYEDAIELLGLSYYRLGEFSDAISELEKFTGLTKNYEQLPVIADCYRALGYYKKMFSTWNFIKTKKLPRSVHGEARLVIAGAYKDLGDIEKAYELMKNCSGDSKQPSFLKLREWYLLADILEQMGDFPNARRLFKKVLQFDPELADVAERATN